MRIVFLGPPGAGKGTQAKLLRERHNMLSVASGNLLRKASREETPTGRRLKKLMSNGRLVPDTVVTQLIVSHLEQFNVTRPLILDGFPRTKEQAVTLKEALADRGQAPVNLAINFKMSDEKVLRRILGRRICRNCGAIYHIETSPPKQEEICDQCNNPLAKRLDDSEEVVPQRLKAYTEQTKPLLEWYEAQGILKEVPGDLDVEPQYEALVGVLNEAGLVEEAS